MATGNGQTKPLRLADARERTPPATAAHAANIQALALGALLAEDVTAIVQKQVEKAKAGDTAAAKFVLGYLGSCAVAPARKPAAPRSEDDEDGPPPVAVPSVATAQLRTLVGLYLLQHQPATVAELGRATATDGQTLAAVLNCEWFETQNGKVTLTPAGRGAIG